MLLLTILIACKGDDAPIPQDSDPAVVVDTQPWHETGLDDSATDDSATDDTGDDTGEAVSATALLVNPGSLLLDPGASVPLRSTLVLSSGELVNVSPSFSSSDEAVATVDVFGVVTAMAAGTATLTAESEGLSAQVQVEVQASPTLYVTVIDATSGLPMEGASVAVDGEAVLTDSTGAASLTVDAADALAVTVWAADEAYIPATFFDVVSRRVILPVRLRSLEDLAPAEISGVADFTGTRAPEWNERRVGLAGATLQRDPLLLDAGQILSPSRTIDFYGLEVDVPANVVLDEVANDWGARVWDGAVGVWAFGGSVAVDELGASLASPSGGIEVLASHMEDFSYGCVGGLSAATGSPLTQDIGFPVAMDGTVQVELPELPDGFLGGEQALVIVLDDAGDAGFAIAGMGLGLAGANTVRRATEGSCGWTGVGPTQILAYAEVNGLGSGEGRVLSMAPLEEGAAVIPAWMTPPSVPNLTAATRIFEVESDTRAVLVHAYVLAGDGSDRDVWMNGGDSSQTMPEVGPSIGLGRSTWSMLAVETDESTYDSLLIEGAVRDDELAARARTSAGWRQLVRGGSGG